VGLSKVFVGRKSTKTKQGPMEEENHCLQLARVGVGGDGLCPSHFIFLFEQMQKQGPP